MLDKSGEFCIYRRKDDRHIFVFRQKEIAYVLHTLSRTDIKGFDVTAEEVVLFRVGSHKPFLAGFYEVNASAKDVSTCVQRMLAFEAQELITKEQERLAKARQEYERRLAEIAQYEAQKHLAEQKEKLAAEARARLVEQALREKEEARIQAIKAIVHGRRITELVHFTRIENLHRILKYGILPVNEMRLKEIQHLHNDHERHDKRLYTVSLSVSFPNYKMFYKYQQSGGSYAVLVIDTSVLWENECLFCRTNAASSTIRSKDDNELRSAESFKNMFGGDEIRQSNQIRHCDPTDPQAEILVVGKVDFEKIQKIVFSDSQHLNNFLEQTNLLETCEATLNSLYFKPRYDYDRIGGTHFG
ncbi:MAG: DarT ssDNA thymidine ADP-ribosyltransferase family protein [Zoogloeaceae bacterium]|jgi:hypothetical protein|nr:DarT ssDNA thymidine ADP-ribosyltransferase family protein [Zoogloeaceae bacterium]